MTAEEAKNFNRLFWKLEQQTSSIQRELTRTIQYGHTDILKKSELLDALRTMHAEISEFIEQNQDAPELDAE